MLVSFDTRLVGRSFQTNNPFRFNIFQLQLTDPRFLPEVDTFVIGNFLCIYDVLVLIEYLINYQK